MNPDQMEDIKTKADSLFYSETEVIKFTKYLLKWEGYLPENIPMCIAIWKKHPYEPPIEKSDRPRVERTSSAIEDILNITCEYYDIPLEQVGLKTRKRKTVQARQVAMFIIKSLTKTSLSVIGKKIGGKDHSTVLHAYRKVVPNAIETDREYRTGVADILSTISDTVPEVSRKAHNLMLKVEEGKVD